MADVLNAAARSLEVQMEVVNSSTSDLSNPAADVSLSAAEREIIVSRLIDAPQSRVFEAWTDRAQVAQWWGPRGFTNTILEMNVVPGGIWRLVTHGPDGEAFSNTMTFEEVVAPERLVYTGGGGDNAADQFDVEVTFADRSGKTYVTMRMLFATPAAREQMVELGAIECGNSSLEDLEEFLASRV